MNDPEVYFVLCCLTQAFESGQNLLPNEFLEKSNRINSMSQYFGFQESNTALSVLYDQILETRGAGNEVRIQSESYPAIHALYLDFSVRYEESPDDLFSHVYNFLTL